MIDGGPAIRWGNLYLPVSRNGDVKVGSTVLAAWRPEAAVVSESATVPRALRGLIELVTFLRPITRLDVRLYGDSEPVLVDLVFATARTFAADNAVAIVVPRRRSVSTGSWPKSIGMSRPPDSHLGWHGHASCRLECV